MARLAQAGLARADLARTIQLAIAAFITIAIASTSPAVAQTQRQLGWCLHKEETFAPQLRIFGCTAAIKSNRFSGQDLYTAFYNRGIAYFKLNQHDRAIADFDQAIELDPNSFHALSNRGTAYARTREYDRAIEDFNQAIRLNASYAITFNNRGSAYAKKGEYDRAIEDFEQAIRLDPKDSSARNNRKLAEHLKGKTAHAEAAVANANRNRNPPEQMKVKTARTEVAIANADRNHNPPEQVKVIPPEADKNDANVNNNPEPAKQLKDKTTTADRQAAVASKPRNPAAIKSKSKVQNKSRIAAVRSRRTKPPLLVRFIRQQQLNIRKVFRMVSQR